jgi:hypothetical protein
MGHNNGVFYSKNNAGAYQLAYQIQGIVITIVWSAAVTLILLKGLDLTMGLRVSEEDEDLGIDRVLHGESIVPTERRAAKKQTYHAHTAVPVSRLVAAGIISVMSSLKPMNISSEKNISRFDEKSSDSHKI